MAVSRAIFVVFGMVTCSYGAAIQGPVSGGIRPTNITIRVLSVQKKIVGYDKTSLCITLDNLQEFVVDGIDQADSDFCIVLFKDARDCPLLHNFLITSENLAETRNLPPFQAVKNCSPTQRAAARGNGGIITV